MMTENERIKCHTIIHTHAVTCGAGNAIPVPGLGIAVDMIMLTSMAISLAAVFGGNLSFAAAKGLAAATLKKTALNQPLKTLTKELSKIFPFLSSFVAPTMSLAFTEAAGWALANELYISNGATSSGLIRQFRNY